MLFVQHKIKLLWFKYNLLQIYLIFCYINECNVIEGLWQTQEFDLRIYPTKLLVTNNSTNKCYYPQSCINFVLHCLPLLLNRISLINPVNHFCMLIFILAMHTIWQIHCTIYLHLLRVLETHHAAEMALLRLMHLPAVYNLTKSSFYSMNSSKQWWLQLESNVY